jgi:hypothetical protein
MITDLHLNTFNLKEFHPQSLVTLNHSQLSHHHFRRYPMSESPLLRENMHLLVHIERNDEYDKIILKTNFEIKNVVLLKPYA